MPLTNSMVEQLADWCLKSGNLADIRLKARSDFFGDDEPGIIKYLADVGDVTSRERRFLGWFSFGLKLPDGRHPAELGAAALFSGSLLVSAKKSIQDSRCITAIVKMVIPGEGVYLELEDEELDVSSRVLSRALYKDDVLCAHVLPATRGRWLVAPGWLV